MMKYLTIAVLSLAILAGSPDFSRRTRRIMGIYVQRIREKVPDPQRKQCRRCSRLQFHFLCVSQRQLDLYLGQKRQETQHPFRPIIGKRLRSYRITNFEVECPATALAGWGKSVCQFYS